MLFRSVLAFCQFDHSERLGTGPIDKGFQMAHPIPWKPLSVTAIRSRLRTRHNELPVHVVSLTSSTQDDAQSALKSGAPHGTLFAAERQTKGRGRHGRRWLTTPGNLLFSLVIRGVATGSDTLGQLTIAVVVSIAQVLEHHTGASALIKWPNDIMFGQAKAGGVLIKIGRASCRERV